MPQISLISTNIMITTKKTLNYFTFLFFLSEERQILSCLTSVLAILLKRAVDKMIEALKVQQLNRRK